MGAASSGSTTEDMRLSEVVPERPACDLWTMGEIAVFLTCSVKTVERMIGQKIDPLPVMKVRGRIGASSGEINAWLRRSARVAA